MNPAKDLFIGAEVENVFDKAQRGTIISLDPYYAMVKWHDQLGGASQVERKWLRRHGVKPLWHKTADEIEELYDIPVPQRRERLEDLLERFADEVRNA